MLVISVPTSKLKEYGLHERSNDQEWMKAVANRLWHLGVRAEDQTVVAIMTGEKVDSQADLVALASIRVVDKKRIELTREPLFNESELRRTIRNSHVLLTRNPVQYMDLEEELKPCACGCGRMVKRTFSMGHDQKMIHDRIRLYFDGDILKAIAEIDRVFGNQEQKDQ